MGGQAEVHRRGEAWNSPPKPPFRLSKRSCSISPQRWMAALYWEVDICCPSPAAGRQGQHCEPLQRIPSKSLEVCFPPEGNSWRPRPVRPVTCSLRGLLQLPHGASTLLLYLCLLGLPQPSNALQHLVEAGAPIGLLWTQGGVSDDGAGAMDTARQRGIPGRLPHSDDG